MYVYNIYIYGKRVLYTESPGLSKFLLYLRRDTAVSFKRAQMAKRAKLFKWHVQLLRSQTSPRHSEVRCGFEVWLEMVAKGSEWWSMQWPCVARSGGIQYFLF